MFGLVYFPDAPVPLTPRDRRRRREGGREGGSRVSLCRPVMFIHLHLLLLSPSSPQHLPRYCSLCCFEKWDGHESQVLALLPSESERILSDLPSPDPHHSSSPTRASEPSSSTNGVAGSSADPPTRSDELQEELEAII
ncbi:hypothetical protein E2C01_058017 [Portunus trituberculatus]|uniref:Uncharacterized protein n=1 Tax=Portunus trituberculatus TaxID=210409 RepID=A0A5B7H1W3_PORTR|nr:hypothetical protein [Portunus trituberculatus]